MCVCVFTEHFPFLKPREYNQLSFVLIPKYYSKRSVLCGGPLSIFIAATLFTLLYFFAFPVQVMEYFWKFFHFSGKYDQRRHST